ncbi:unnamed protein product [Medioppia subpectinata]|uniref:Transmembrane protein 19 n=1 Tax=Medioppia subpectinata TaxID=1979941 RepID=A0A7R9Q3F6_9ACAR|nr:unnamed protein product [Medioppia subpectinata]CAG2111385.1 unnamed protein product [Medioppia subpectinata]
MNLGIILATFLPASLFLSILFPNPSNGVSGHTSPFRYLLSLSIPAFIGWKALNKKSLDLSGFLTAMMCGFVLTLSNYCFTVSLLVFFVSSSKATKYKSERKREIEVDYKEGGQRNWVQVISNGGVATLLAIFYLLQNGSGETAINFITDYETSWLATSALGAICCANGDTWASELGSVLSTGNPYLITTLKPVPKGTNGGISIIGLIVSALGGIVVSFGFLLTLMLCVESEAYNSSPPQWPLLIVGLFSGLFGSLVDSLLGATLQYSGFDKETNKVVEIEGQHIQHISGRLLLDNHSVNLLSNLFTAIVSPYFALYLWTNISSIET